MLISIFIYSFVIGGAFFYLLSFIANSSFSKNREEGEKLSFFLKHSVGVLSILATILIIIKSIIS